MDRTQADKNLWENIRNRTVTLTMIGSTQIDGTAAPQVGPLLGGYGFASENGNLFDYAQGIEQLQFENGGVDTGIYRGTQAAIHKFAEKDTIWEAYISGKPSQHDRNIAIWEATGDRLGVDRGGQGPVMVNVAAPVVQMPQALIVDIGGQQMTAYVRGVADEAVAAKYRTSALSYSGGKTAL
jgi:hypothetical protein